MKKFVLVIMAFISFTVFASTRVNPDSYVNNNCNELSDSNEKQACVNTEKKNEAQENFKNFEENSRSAYQQDF